MTTYIILIVLAIILGVLYFMKRSARLKKQTKKDI
jgi:prolipoprotein diacylglyceryltransferase